MDDKTELAALMTKIAASLDAMERSTKEIADVLQTMRNQAEAELKIKTAQLRAITEAPQPGLMSGRWHRRNGDGFPIVAPREQAVDAANAEIVRQMKEDHANRPPGNIRSPGVSGD